MRPTRRVIRWTVDVFITLIVAFCVVCSYLGKIVPYRQGFHCEDPSLDYQFTGDSISLELLLGITLIAPVFLILPVEYFRHNPCKVVQKADGSSQSINASHRLRMYWRCCGRIYLSYFHGILCAGALVEFLKMTVGGLRPHFLRSCKPDFSMINCSEGFITNYTCTNRYNMSVLYYSDLFKSFPSGHAALSMFMSLYLCFYIQKQIHPWPTYLSSSLFQVLLLFWAGYCAASRLTDHRHHWWDVVVGSLIGILCACYSAMWLYLNVRCPSEVLSSGSSLLASNRFNCYESNQRHPRRHALSSQASQTTDLSDSYSLNSPVLLPPDQNHVPV